MRQAVALLLPRKDGKVLAVSRGLLRPGNLGLPGGKIEERDLSPVEAVIRETYEETGIVISSPEPIYERPSWGPTDFHCTVFRARWISGKPRVCTAEGWVRWVYPEVLYAGSFGAYNMALLNHVRKHNIFAI